MSLKDRFQKFLGLETKSGLANPDDWLIDLFNSRPSTAGVNVTPRSAMTCPPVRRAVQLVSENVAHLPVHVIRWNEDGSKERASDHHAERLLTIQANPSTSPFRLIQEVTRDALLYPGGGFAHIVRVEGRPVELIRINPEVERVTVETGDDYQPVYSIALKDGKKRIIPADRILHIPSPSFNQRGVVEEGRDTIGLALSLERHAALLFANGAKPSGVLSLKDIKSPDAFAKAKAAWQSAQSGGNSGGTAVLPVDASWEQLTLTSVDAQFLELRQFAIADIARLFGVPTPLLFELGRATYANSEEMDAAFLRYTILPWITAWQDELMLKLLTEQERETYFIEFKIDGFARADLAARSTAYTAAAGGPWMAPNEVRSMENLPPIEGGDKLRPPANASGVMAGNSNTNMGEAA